MKKKALMKRIVTAALSGFLAFASVSISPLEVFAEQPAAAEQGVLSAEITSAATASASSAWQSASYAVDGKLDTRWESEQSDPQWICLDFQQDCRFDSINIAWEVASAKTYEVQVSGNGTDWMSVASVTDGTEGEYRTLQLGGVTGRYVRIYGTERTTGYGYSIWEVNVYGQCFGTEHNPGSDLGEQPGGGSYTGGNTTAAETLKQSCPLLSKGHPAYASTTEGGDAATRMTDGDIATSWKSANGVLGIDRIQEQWFEVDLGAVKEISGVIIDWTAANTCATEFLLQVSEDEINWTTIGNVKNKDGGTLVTYTFADGNQDTYPEIVLNQLQASGRYVRVYASESIGAAPIQVREFQIYGLESEMPQTARDLAAGAAVSASSTAVPWWASSADLLSAEKAVDGNYDSYWLSDAAADYNDAWFQVDLGEVYRIGKVQIQWQVEFGRVYELQVSTDGADWKTVYRETYGYGEDAQIPMCEDVRYVRLQGIAMGRGSGYSIRELNVYEWQQGDVAETPALKERTTPEVISTGKGSYITGDDTMAQPRYPAYHTDNISVPIPSNDWWTSVLYTRLSDGIPTLPYSLQYTDTGLALYYASDLFTSPNNGGMDSKDQNYDLTINSSNIVGTPAAKVDGYGDWSVEVQYSDDDTPKMMTTIVKGSPYLYNTFADGTSAEVGITGLMGFYDISGAEILAEDGQSVATDFIGVTCKYMVTSPEVNQPYKYHQYGLFLPEGAVVSRLGSKLKVNLGDGTQYMVVGIIPSTDKLDVKGYDLDTVQQLYAHAYAYVTDTNVSYTYSEQQATITTRYGVTTETKRAGFSSEPLVGLLPTQWKYATADTEGKLQAGMPAYHSARGALKTIASSDFEISDVFHGVIPVFAEPVESAHYDREAMVEYLHTFYESVKKEYWVADPYWQGKKNHPLTMAILIADQLGETQIRDEMIIILRKIMENWLTYDGGDDYPYYMYYSESWGTLSGDGGDHGMAMNLSDHHFLWAYFIFPAAVLASYDHQFLEGYGDMIELLIRDCMNPDRNDALFPWMRNFDPYEGHSWAGGYGDNQSGNNQESTSEATFAWAGLYLWGLVTKNQTYRDAGIWGFTQEVNAVEQYWFDYDGDNWDDAYTSGVVGMVWGSSYTNGTYFSGNPSCIYGIHMLPVTGALAYLGENREANQSVWASYQQDQSAYQAKLKARTEDPNDEYYGVDYTTIDPEGWFHILWPYEALGDVDHVLQEMDCTSFPNDELFNSYWFIMNMDAKGYLASDVWASNYTAYEIFRNESGAYVATVWNPGEEPIYVEFANASGKIGSAYISAHAITSVDPFQDTPASETAVEYVVPQIEEKPIVLPGLLQAEDYTTNFNCSIWNDAAEGDYVGSITKDSKLVYRVNVAQTGVYHLGLHAMNYGDGPVTVEIYDDAEEHLLASITVPKEGDTAWTTANTRLELAAGEQTWKVKFLSGNLNFSWLDVYKEGDRPNYDKYDPSVEDPYENLALGSVIIASSTINGNGAANVIDNDASTRWESEFVDPQYLTVDLGQTSNIQGFKILWEGAAGKEYTIAVSQDNENWTTIVEKHNGTGGHIFKEILDQPVQARYVKLYGTERTGGYGYSIYEFYIYGEEKQQEQEKTWEERLAAPPEGVTAVYQQDGTIVLNWQDCDAVQYKVSRSDGRSGYVNLTYRASASGWVDGAVEKGQLYYYRVTPYFRDTAGNLVSGSVSEAAVVVATDQLPDKVVNVQAATASGQVTLTWNKAEGARYYKVSRASGATGKYYTMKYNILENSYTDTSVSKGLYRYKVVGYYKDVDGSWVYGELSDTLYVTVK